MPGLFDKNGNATETHIATVSGFDFTTGEHIATYDVRILEGTGIPGLSTLTLAPDADNGHAVCWNGDSWVQVIDMRGTTAYEKATGEPATVKTLGPLSDALTSIIPVTPYDKWDGSQWVTDIDAQHAADVAAAGMKKQDLIDQANAYMNSKQWPGKAAMGRLKDAEKEQYNAWLDYLDALEVVDTSSAPDINWPDSPEV